jgi:DNA-binding NarL/FixJ family response regulator
LYPVVAVSVLLVDDVPDLRFVVRMVLERTDRFTVVGEAGDGIEAIRLAAELQPDLALLDLTMPRMGGVEALPRIRAASPNTKVVVLSGWESHLALASTGAGAVAYLEKGISPTRLVDELLMIAGLLETVEQAVDESRARLAGEPQSAGSARRFVEETLQRWECGHDLDTVNLLVSEVVSNAIIHAPGELEVSVRLRSHSIRIEVNDDSRDLPVLRDAEDDDISGRGMALVEALATGWGVSDRSEGGKTVWFEVPRFDDAPIG